MNTTDKKLADAQAAAAVSMAEARESACEAKTAVTDAASAAKESAADKLGDIKEIGRASCRERV